MMSQKDVCFSCHLLALLISVQLKLALFTLSEELLEPHMHTFPAWQAQWKEQVFPLAWARELREDYDWPDGVRGPSLNQST